MKAKLITLTLFLLTTILARGQNNDWILSVNNDTTHCKITSNFFSGAYKYSTNDSGPKKKIKAEAIREFYLADKKMWFRKIYFDGNNYRLMRVLERGKISLYETLGYYLNNGGTYEMWYATKNCDTGVYIKTDALVILSGTKKGKKIFVGYLADNKPVQDQYIADDNPEIDEIQRLVRWYNSGVRPASGGN